MHSGHVQVHPGTTGRSAGGYRTLIVNLGTVSKKEFCVMVAVIPKILYRPEKAVYDYWAHKLSLNQQKKELIKLRESPLLP